MIKCDTQRGKLVSDKRSNTRALKAEHWELFAVVGPGSTNNAKYSFTLSEWSVEDHSVFMIFRRTFSTGFQDEVIYSAIAELEHILISLFINDHVPRKLFYFWYPTSLDKETRVRLLFMLGQTRSALEPDPTVLSQSFQQTGWIFNKKTDWPLDTLPPNTSIKEWFDLLRNDESIAGSVGLLQNSFATINRMSGQYRYYDYWELSAALILMVSGLESLFFSRSDEHADISFKFKIVGTAYYTKYVTDEFFLRFGEDERKLGASQVMELLAALYGLRSKIAHGKSRAIFLGKQAKDWKKVFDILRVQWKEPDDKKMFFSHLLLALGLLQKHIFALIWCSKENLSKGVNPGLFGG